MANIFSKFFRKESHSMQIATMLQQGKAQSSPNNFASFARNGYSKNAIVYIAVSKIASQCASVDWLLYKKSKGNRRKEKTEILDSPLLTLLDKPNPLMAKSTFIETIVGYRLISGNSFLEANTGATGSTPLELWPMRPDHVKIVPGKNGYIEKYVYSVNGNEYVFPVDMVKLTSKVMQWKSFNPLDFYFGLSPLQAAMSSLDQNNQAALWNLALLQNSATPSGVLQMKVSDQNPRGSLTNEQYQNLKLELDNYQSGPRNAGRPMILEGGLSWQQIALSPKDMNFIESKHLTSTDLLSIYGVPGELVGIGEKKFNNYKEARLAFIEDTCIPHLNSLRDAFNMWLSPSFGEDLYLDIDKDSIDALVEKRESKFTSIGSASFLSENEKRKEVGFDDVIGFDIFKVGNDFFTKEELQRMADPEQAGTDNQSSLTGIQITSLLDVVGQVANGKIPRQTGLEIIKVSFNLSDEQANNILAEVGLGFVPTPDVENAPSNSTQNQPPQKPTTSETDDSDLDDSEETDDEDEKAEIKIFNTLNRNERLTSWKRQNNRKRRLENLFAKDVEEDFQKLLKNLKSTAEKLPKNTEGRLAEFALAKEISEWTEILEKTLTKYTRASLEEFGQIVLRDAKSQGLVLETKKNLDWESFVTSYIKKRTGTQISTITSTTQKQIRRIVKEWTQDAITQGESVNDLSFYLQTEFEGLTKSNAQRIARTEVQMASNNGTLEAVKSLQVPGIVKEWVSANDSRVRDGGKDGNGPDHSTVGDENGEIPLDDKFKVNPDVLMDCPGDISAPADTVINCRCVLVFKQKGD